MKIESLSYVSIETTDLQEWDDYAKNVVGLMKNESLLALVISATRYSLTAGPIAPLIESTGTVHLP